MRLGNEVLGITGGGFRLALLDDSKPQRPCQWYVSHHHVNNLLQSVVRHHHENNLLQNLRWSRRNLGRRGFSSDQVLLVLLTYARLREHLFCKRGPRLPENLGVVHRFRALHVQAPVLYYRRRALLHVESQDERT